MAYMDRGSGPTVSNNNDSGSNNTSGFNDIHMNYYVPVDNTYVRIQIITTITILIAGAIAYMITYESTIVDPIANAKKVFIDTHLILIGVLLATTIILHVVLRKARILTKSIIAVFVVSIVSMMIFGGIRLKMDNDYTKDRFEQFYLEQNTNTKSSTKQKLDIGLSGVKMKSAEEYYVDECEKLYSSFKLKTYGTLGLHLLLNILLTYEISRLSKIDERKDRVNNDDLILFDEEQNVKY